MAADRPAPTVTTNTDRVGSDRKIHPWEHRVLSVLEVADLQTIPRSYDWSRALNEERTYLIRNLVGEAFPPYFTYLHGTPLARVLVGEEIHPMEFASTRPEMSAPVRLAGATTDFCEPRLVHAS